MTTSPDVRTTCISACADKKGRTLALVVKDNGEDFYSFIFRVLDPKTAERESVYEAPVWLTSMWCSPAGAIYAVDVDGRVHSDETGKFVTTDTRSKPGLTWVWGLDEKNVFASGDAGTAVRKAGRGWEHFDQGLDGDLYELRGAAVNDLYTVGEQGRIFHHDGRAWSRIDPFTNHTLNSVLSVGDDVVYACGEGGMVFRGSKARWVRLSAPAVTFYSLALFQDRVYLAAGADGVFVVEGDTVTLVRKNRNYYTLVATPKILYAAGDDFAGRFDGNEWKGNRFT